MTRILRLPLTSIAMAFSHSDKGDTMTETIYSYGMRLRGFSIGCQPMKGLLFTADDESGRYYDLLVYDRKLTDKELSDYELDYIGDGKMNPSKVPHHKN